LNDSATLESRRLDPDAPIGFPVSTVKFWVMSLLTMNLYLAYWAFKNFDKLKAKGNKWISAIFIKFSFFYLLEGIENQAASAGKPIHLRKILLAVCFFLVGVLSVATSKSSLLSVIVMVLTVIPCAVAQRALLNVNQELRPGAGIDSKFSFWDIAGASIGGLLLVVGFLVPTP